ncbi:hypothetical protein [uncultured Marivirga sp.]|uniref:hypothetical protein n=1 Tax=uncultured Marivirga sp. TaxID=1123707 RepID=UPI0030EF744B|tara:strand:+ start:25478 stop:26062 length:585 start_codon:yes stop_codon:yes gene_type:complete
MNRLVNKATKKFIAREFLIVLSIIILAVLIYCSFLLYNLIINYKIDSYTESLIELSYENYPVDDTSKVSLLLKGLKDNSKATEFHNYSANQFIDSLSQKESSNRLHQKLFNSPYVKGIPEYDKFASAFRLKYLKKKDRLKQQIVENKNKLISTAEIYNKTRLLIIILLLIIYPVRWLYFSIKWSVKTLKEKGNS